MKALITALALLSFVGASTLPLATSAQAATTDQTQTHKKSTKKHVAHKKSTTKHVAHKTSTKKHVAKHKTKKPTTQPS
jgi:Ni/Co efflux regulator RcnB